MKRLKNEKRKERNNNKKYSENALQIVNELTWLTIFSYHGMEHHTIHLVFFCAVHSTYV